MDVNGEVGLRTVEDLVDLNDDDLEGISDTVHMNILEKKRFMKAVQSLKSSRAVSDPAIGADDALAVEEFTDPAELDAAMAGEANSVHQFEVLKADVHIRKSAGSDEPIVGTLSKGRVIHAHKERVLGIDGQVWAEVTPLEFRRSCQTNTDAKRGFVLIDGRHTGEGQQLRLLDTPGNQGQIRGVEMAVDTFMSEEDMQEAMTSIAEVPDHANVFEVVKSVVFVQKAPNADAARVGALKKGRVVHVKKEMAVDEDGHSWVELTNFELWRSCEPTDANDRGFALVDGTHLGLGPLLRGPLPRDAAVWANARVGISASKATRAMAALSKTQPKPKPFDGMKDHIDLYKVVKSLVYVKGSPDGGAKTLGCLKRGQIVQAFRALAHDHTGHAWAELTSYELWHSCKPGANDDRGFALINGEHLNLGTLLEGPLSKVQFADWQEQQLKEQMAARTQKLAERAQRTRDAEEIQRKRRDEAWDSNTPIYEYHAMRDRVLMKWSEDPRHEWIVASACQPGTVFHSTGMEWRGPNGERWIDGCSVDGKPRWVLAEDPLAWGGPFLVEKTFIEKHMLVSVHYPTVRGGECFDTFIDKHAPVEALKKRLCSELNISPDVIQLKSSSSGALQAKALSDKSSLSGQRIMSSSQVFAEYDQNLYNLMMAGRGFGWI